MIDYDLVAFSHEDIFNNSNDVDIMDKETITI